MLKEYELLSRGGIVNKAIIFGNFKVGAGNYS
jgi:hypothetical protein